MYFDPPTLLEPTYFLLNKKVKEMIQCLFSAVRVDRRKDDSLNSSSSLQ